MTSVRNLALIAGEWVRLLTPEERQALAAWEALHLGDGKTGTSDWPGWARFEKQVN